MCLEWNNKSHVGITRREPKTYAFNTGTPSSTGRRSVNGEWNRNQKEKRNAASMAIASARTVSSGIKKSFRLCPGILECTILERGKFGTRVPDATV
jgi:hypothetical protein